MKTGDRVGEYTLGTCLGSGGMCEVFATERSDIVIKTMLDAIFANSPFLNNRVAEEASILAKLRGVSKGVAQYIHHDMTSDGRVYIVMRRLLGQPLYRKKDLGIHTVLRVARELTETLCHTHDLGIIHRDVKPGNVMYRPSLDKDKPIVTLFDFGLARDTRRPMNRLTRPGIQGFGTPPYLSPEQLYCGRDATSKADMHALGCTLYELLTDSDLHLVRGSGNDMVFRSMASKPPRVEIPEAFWRAIALLTDRDPRVRLSAPQFLNFLDNGSLP